MIGVYEPLVAMQDGRALETSRAAALDDDLRGELYHRDCYQAQMETPPQRRALP